MKIHVPYDCNESLSGFLRLLQLNTILSYVRIKCTFLYLLILGILADEYLIRNMKAFIFCALT